MHVRRTLTIAAIAVAIVSSIDTTLARVDVQVDFDKTFNFQQVRTWGWPQAGPGDVKMARTKDDDPEAMRQKVEPWIVDAVDKEMARLKLERVVNEPDLTVRYYVLLTTTMSTQTMGQFLPAVSGWGLPPFEGRTQSLKMMNRGSLVLDLAAKENIVWRGLAQTNIKLDANDKQREALVREGVRDLLRRYPPKP